MRIVSGTFKNRRLKTPSEEITRPTSERFREALFSICQWKIEGARFIDLFAGSGAVGIEALSRGAEAVTFVDSHRQVVRCIESNLKDLGIKEGAHVLFGDVFMWMDRLEKKGESFDIIFADPPYGKGDSLRVVENIAGGHLLRPGGWLLVEVDRANAWKEDSVFQDLQLISCRKLGRYSFLYHYQF